MFDIIQMYKRLVLIVFDDMFVTFDIIHKSNVLFFDRWRISDSKMVSDIWYQSFNKWRKDKYNCLYKNKFIWFCKNVYIF